MRQEIKDFELCPCGSGKKYKNCCKKKAFKFVRDKEGKVYKRMPVAGDLPKYLQEVSGISLRREMWAEVLGVDVSQMKDAQFINVPYLPKARFAPETLDDIELMKKANIPPEFIYAYQRTGLFVTEHNKRFIPDIELQEFYDAVDEYRKKYKKEGRDREMMKCPHCAHALDRIYEIRVVSEILYWKKEGCYYWAMEKEDILPPDVKFTSEEMMHRIGVEPEFCSTTYLCPYCFYRIPDKEVDGRICKLDWGKNKEEGE